MKLNYTGLVGSSVEHTSKLPHTRGEEDGELTYQLM